LLFYVRVTGGSLQNTHGTPLMTAIIRSGGRAHRFHARFTTGHTRLQEMMTSVDYRNQLGKFGGATDKAFCAAFFLLPLSKTLLFVALAVAFSLLIANGGLAGARRSWRALPWARPALLLAALPVLSLLIHDDLKLGLSYLGLSYYWAIAFMTFFAASRMSVLPWIQSYLCGVFIAFCYMQAKAAGWAGFSYQPSALGNYILYSQFLAMALVLLAVLYRHEERRGRKMLYLGGMALFLGGLVSGNGRSGLLAVLVLMPFIVSNLFRRASAAKIGCACLAALLVVLMTPNVQKRIDAGVNDLQLLQKNVKDTSLGYRFDMWCTAADIVREKPLTGAGPYGFRNEWHSAPRVGEAIGFVEPHNAFLFYATSYGIAGLIALVWLYAALLWSGWIRRHSLEGGIVFAFAVVCVIGSFTNTMFLGTASHAWLMLFIGLQGGLLRNASIGASPIPAHKMALQ
jgi:O-antigen ligase